MIEKKRILVADDEASNTDLFASVLEQSNYRVDKAFDGEECLQVARSAHFDLILLDVNMPKLDGYEVIKQLKRMPHLKHTPVVFLTGYGTSPANIESGYLLGGTEYWTKPIAVQELEVRVRAVLRIAEAEKKLRDAQEVFISMIIHDLRSPLSGIVGFAEFLQEEKDKFEPQLVEMVDAIGSSADLMLTIVTDFLEITRLEMGESKMQRVQVHIPELIERCVFSHSAAQREKSLQVMTQVGELPPLFADPDRMDVVFNHLLDNAIRFTPEKGSISITANAKTDSVVMSVSDTGVGISEEDIPMLFDKMRIATPGSKRAGSRTGLGLPICRGIIEMHGGTL
ncbi:MAG TPA: hybrid sensor histidine kinase/response regulator, partial [Acidobacteriota bacterium]|nr:hybrid sensor histidine kinase/response regulator [Acidobacteriota bacterium]